MQSSGGAPPTVVTGTGGHSPLLIARPRLLRPHRVTGRAGLLASRRRRVNILGAGRRERGDAEGATFGDQLVANPDLQHDAPVSPVAPPFQHVETGTCGTGLTPARRPRRDRRGMAGSPEPRLPPPATTSPAAAVAAP